MSNHTDKVQYLKDLKICSDGSKRHIAFLQYLAETYPQQREALVDAVRIAQQALEALDAKHDSIPETLAELERAIKRSAKRRSKAIGIGAKQRKIASMKKQLARLELEVGECS